MKFNAPAGGKISIHGNWSNSESAVFERMLRFQMSAFRLT
jgi:hypothetical protein